jgi:hypothetical protein
MFSPAPLPDDFFHFKDAALLIPAAAHFSPLYTDLRNAGQYFCRSE